MSKEEIRKSHRPNKGVPPSRYGEDEVEIKPNHDQRSVVKSRNTTVSKNTTTSSSRSRALQAEFEAEQKLAEIARKEMEIARKELKIEKKLVEKELQYKKAIINDIQEENGSLTETYSSTDHLVLETRDEVNDEYKFNSVRKWVNNIPSASMSDKSVSVSFRSDKSESLKLVDNKNFESKEQIAGEAVAEQKSESSKDKITHEKDCKLEKFMARQSLSKELPIFNGDPKDWLHFKTQFQETSKVCGFSNSENLARLQKCLRGKARDSVQGLLNFTCDVEKIVDILEKRFGKPEYIIQDLLSTVRKFPYLKEDKLENIVDLSNIIQNLTMTLSSLDCHAYLLNPQLLSELVAKLTPSLKLEWGKEVCSLKTKTNDLKISDFSDWLSIMADAVSNISSPDFDAEKKRKYVCTTMNSSSEKKFYCGYCKKNNHQLENCLFFKKIEVDKRLDWVRQHKICFCCLNSKHYMSSCRKKKVCNQNGCTRYHHILLHNDNDDNDNQNRAQENYSSHAGESSHNQIVNHHSRILFEKEVLLRVVPVILTGPKAEISTFALFDEASTVTLLCSEIANQIGAVGKTEPLKLRWTNSATSEELESQTVSLKIRGKDEPEQYTIDSVRTVRNLDLPVQSINHKLFSKKWNHLSAIKISSFVNAQPKILLGQDNIDLIIARDVIEAGKNSPVLSRTKLGWVIHGNASSFHNRIDVTLHISKCDDELHEIVKNSFRLENLGIKYPEKKKMSHEDRRALEIMEKTARRQGERWEIGLLWKENVEVMPESKYLATRRLNSIELKMKKNLQFCEEYSGKIAEYIQKGYARKLSPEEIKVKNNKTWYLPHFAVTNPNKPNKIRLVFDAAAKCSGVSLNDFLLKGPDLLNNLLAVLFKFRQKTIAFSSDIKEMFHQINIRKNDRCSQRFLWRNRRENEECIGEYEMNVMTFGAASSPASATFILRKNALEFQNEFPRATNAIIEQHYVDDYLDSVDTEEEAEELIKNVIEIHRRGGFQIRNWVSNSRKVLQNIPHDLRTNQLKDLNIQKELPSEKVLGLFWNTDSDTLGFNINLEKFDGFITHERKSTKREVLRILMSIFDPLGLLLNFSIKAKILLQQIWQSNISWDDELEPSLKERWIKWLIELKNVKRFTVPRCYMIQPHVFNIQLHTFCDSSQKAFAAVSYLRLEMENNIHTTLIMAKSRVSPIKQIISIPRLELQAAVLGSRLSKFILENHSIRFHSIFYWSDSKTVIGWIKSGNAYKFKPFVAHRISEIEENTCISDWRWLSTSENIADDATRSTKPVDWSSESVWINGPSFLKMPESEWLKETRDFPVDYSEVKREFVAVLALDTFSNSLPDIKRFSSWLRLIRTTAWVLRILKIKEMLLDKTKVKLPSELQSNELIAAEIMWIKQVQREMFPEEVYLLLNKMELPKSSKLFKLSPYMDEKGIVRIKGRIGASHWVTEETKKPIILEPKNKFTRLLIHHYHTRAGHHSQNMVTNEIRQKYYIMNLRSAVRSCWNSCQLCKNYRAKPVTPEMAPLPPCRLASFVRPFTFSGMDFFGPMSITTGRRKEKRYGALFTCMSTRAVHLEIVGSLSTDSAIMAMRRLIGRRGNPKRIFCDNGTNLHGAEKELRTALRELDQEELQRFSSVRGIEFQFNSPAAPHMGGSWERLVRSVKVAMKAILKEKAPREEVLWTCMVEAESIVNSRPLVHVPLEAEDDEALTPNHFLIGSSSPILPPGKFSENDLISRKHWRVAQYYADCFWKRWLREYLPTLTRRTKWFTKDPRNVKIGDIVILIDKDLPRNCWPKGRIEAVYPGKDGNVRNVDVKTQAGTYRRPVVKLCLLDVYGGG